jgi:hypothetical protein
MANYFAKQNICQSNEEHRNVQGNGNEAQSGDGGSQAETLQRWGMLLGGGALTVYALARRRFFEEVDVVDFSSLPQRRNCFGSRRLRGFIDNIPFGAAMNKGLTFKMGQTHMMRYMRPLLERVR